MTPSEHQDPAAAKARLRETARQARAAAVAADSGDAPSRVAVHLLARYGDIATDGVVSGYLAIGDELDVAPALTSFRTAGWRTALPVVVAPATPLVFRQWQPGAPLEAGPLKTRHPSPQAAETAPDILLVPLLAFDGAGYRIGWGGGFYDRTLAALRQGKRVHAVGVGYAAQRVDAIPRDRHDARLDAIITEAGLMEVSETS